MIKKWLAKLDEKDFSSHYADDFCGSCITTGVAMAVISLCISGLLRHIGVTDWFQAHFLVRGLTCIILGALTTIVASAFGKEGMSTESNQFVLYFVFVIEILLMTLLSDAFWGIFLGLSLLSSFLLTLYGEISEKWFWRITAIGIIVAVVLYILAGFFLLDLKYNNTFDFIVGAYLTFMIPYSLRRVVLVALTIYDVDERDETDKNLIFLLKAIRQYPLANGYQIGKNLFFVTFINIGEILSEFSDSPKK